jgi:ferric-dicitrate binding protein FerR (iron transport regulator)
VESAPASEASEVPPPEEASRGWVFQGLLAAGLLLVLGAGLLWWLSTGLPHSLPPEGDIARVEVLTGRGECGGLSTGDVLREGALLRTCTDSGMALRLAVGASLRVDARTSVRFLSSDRLELVSGTIYLDCQPEEVSSPIEVVTPFGSLYDLGTQYLITVDESRMALRVREGSVELRSEGAVHRAAAGSALVALRDGTVQRVEAISPTGPSWDWVLPLAPGFELDGRSLADFLQWVHRETGYQVLFLEPDLATAAEGILLRGHIDGLSPGQALEAVLPTTGLRHEISGSELRICRSRRPIS